MLKLVYGGGVRMTNLTEAPNIGKVVAEQLRQVGIEDLETLRQVGSREAWLKIQQIDSSACIHRLYSFEGAIQGIKKTMLSPEEKADLKAFYHAHKLYI